MMKRYLAVLAVVLGTVACEPVVSSAEAHTGSPPMTTFSTGQTLTASALNGNFSHIHNTLSGAILDENISASAAISSSKLADGYMIPKGMARTRTACNAAGAALTACASTTARGRITQIESTGSTGVYLVRTTGPMDPNESYAIVQSHQSGSTCITAGMDGSVVNGYQVLCRDAASAFINVPFTTLVW